MHRLSHCASLVCRISGANCVAKPAVSPPKMSKFGHLGASKKTRSTKKPQNTHQHNTHPKKTQQNCHPIHWAFYICFKPWDRWIGGGFRWLWQDPHSLGRATGSLRAMTLMQSLCDSFSAGEVVMVMEMEMGMVMDDLRFLTSKDINKKRVHLVWKIPQFFG